LFTIDTIPAKIYFKILETGKVQLLSQDKLELSKLKDSWNEIVDKYAESNKTIKSEKIFSLSKQIQELKLQYESIVNALIVLKEFKDDDLIKLIESYGYRISDENYLQDIDLIERESKAIKIKINRFSKDLENYTPEKEETEKNTSFDELYMGYMVFLEFPFKDSNTVTLLEFSSIEKQVLSKIKSLKNNGKR
jgi:hypothetical protein